jgi:hypothetical protein
LPNRGRVRRGGVCKVGHGLVHHIQAHKHDDDGYDDADEDGASSCLRVNWDSVAVGPLARPKTVMSIGLVGAPLAPALGGQLVMGFGIRVAADALLPHVKFLPDNRDMIEWRVGVGPGFASF